MIPARGQGRAEGSCWAQGDPLPACPACSAAGQELWGEGPRCRGGRGRREEVAWAAGDTALPAKVPEGDAGQARGHCRQAGLLYHSESTDRLRAQPSFARLPAACPVH